MAATAQWYSKMMKDIDRFIESIALLLETADGPIKEYELIQQLNHQGWNLSTSAVEPLKLFTTHFLVYHSLYHLQAHYWQQQQFLEVSALLIQLHPPCSEQMLSNAIAEYRGAEKLRDYYLNLDNLEEATEESVNQLLNSFWERFVATDESTSALDIMSLTMPVTYTEVKQRYRSLAMTHHPDRGGDPEEFQQINWAFGVLQRVLKPQNS